MTAIDHLTIVWFVGGIIVGKIFADLFLCLLEVRDDRRYWKECREAMERSRRFRQ
jgi:hypothetical protein